MKLSNLPRLKAKSKKRVGQGHGSGRVKTSGRGQKGLKARGSVSISYEGGGLPLIKRLPFMRGKGRNKTIKNKQIGVNVGNLNLLKNGSVVDLKALIDNKIVEEKEANLSGVKILGDGDLKVALKVSLPMTSGALKKIEKAGGSASA